MKWSIFLPGFALASILFFQLLFYVWKKEDWRKFKLNQQTPADKVQRKERKYSLISLFIFAIAGILMEWLEQAGWTQIYYEVDGIGWLYLLPSFFLAFLIHDGYFYWTHRLLHVKWLYKHVHIWHHSFNNPTPFSAFAFHPIEGIMQIAIVPLVAVLIPIHWSVLVFFAGFLLAMTVYGHCGFEMRANKTGIFRLFNTSLHHYQHHRHVRYNFGIYMNMWDALMGTNHHSYPEVLGEFWKESQKAHPKTVS